MKLHMQLYGNYISHIQHINFAKHDYVLSHTREKLIISNKGYDGHEIQSTWQK
jgi:hypothetical protein